MTNRRTERLKVTTCVFPDCRADVTQRWDLPVCDRHVLKVYRSVEALLDLERASGSEGTRAAERERAT